MTPAPISTLAAAREVLASCVLMRVAIQVLTGVPDVGVSLAVAPAKVLPDAMKALLRRPAVCHVIAQHLEAGVARFAVTTEDPHAQTCAAFAHIAYALLTMEQRDFWIERAAIREYDGGMPRPRAELLALFDTLDHASTIEAIATLTAA